jgi:hypothetical protein
MADTHEFGPKSPTRNRIPLSDGNVTPDCSECPRSGDLMHYLDTGEGPFVTNEETRTHLRQVLTRSPDLAAFSIAMFSEGLCSFAMIQDRVVDERKIPGRTVLEVLHIVAEGSCVEFDRVHRKGHQLGDE